MQAMRLPGQRTPAGVTPFTCRRLHPRVVSRAASSNGQSVEGNTTIHKLIKENGILLVPGVRSYNVGCSESLTQQEQQQSTRDA